MPVKMAKHTVSLKFFSLQYPLGWPPSLKVSPLLARNVVKFKNATSACFFRFLHTESISLVDAGPSAGLSFPDLSKSHLSKYLSVCLLPEPSLMAPEVSSGVHALLNPSKDVKDYRQNGNTNVLEKYGFEIEAKPRIKAELAKTGEKYTSELTANSHPCGDCYKTFESGKNLKMHVAIKHKPERKEIDYKCNQCGEHFNKLTTGHRSLRASLSLKELFERHLWTHKVADFKCNCDDVPDLRPGKVIF